MSLISACTTEMPLGLTARISPRKLADVTDATFSQNTEFGSAVNLGLKCTVCSRGSSEFDYCRGG